MGGSRGGRLARAILSGAIAALILFFLVRSLRRSWNEAGVFDWGIDPGWLALSIVLLALYFFLAAWIWRLVLRALGEEIGLADACRIWYFSQMGKYVPGKVWFAVGRIVLCRQVGVGAAAASISTVLELLLVILAAAAVFLVSLPLWPSVDAKVLTLAPIGAAAIIVVLHPSVFSRILRWAAKVLRREPMSYPLRWRDLGIIVGAYAITWIVYGAGLECLLRAIRLGEAVAAPELALPGRILFFAGAAGVAWAIGFLSVITPSGLGVREATLGFFLNVHLAAPLPVLLALVARLWMTVGEIGSALVAFGLGGKRDES